MHAPNVLSPKTNEHYTIATEPNKYSKTSHCQSQQHSWIGVLPGILCTHALLRSLGVFQVNRYINP
jgi:hypothetical protein